MNRHIHMMQNWKQKIRPKVLHSPHIKNTQIPGQIIHIWTFYQKKKKKTHQIQTKIKPLSMSTPISQKHE